MAYTGPRVVCRRCGQSFSRPADRRRHLAERRCPGRSGQPQAIVPARPKPVGGEVIDVTPVRSEIVRPGRESVTARRVQAETRIVAARPKPGATEIPSGERPPSWWEPQADSQWRSKVWAGFPPDYRERLLAQRAGAVFSIRPPEAADKVILRSQYHALKALAVRLDAGIATERERGAFEAGLREYNANYDRIQSQRKALPG